MWVTFKSVLLAKAKGKGGYNYLKDLLKITTWFWFYCCMSVWLNLVCWNSDKAWLVGNRSENIPFMTGTWTSEAIKKNFNGARIENALKSHFWWNQIFFLPLLPTTVKSQVEWSHCMVLTQAGKLGLSSVLRSGKRSNL